MPREIDNHTERTLMNGVVFAMTQIASSTHRKHLGLKGRYSLIITLFMGLGLLVIAGTVLSRILHLGNDQVYTLLNTHMQMVAKPDRRHVLRGSRPGSADEPRRSSR